MTTSSSDFSAAEIRRLLDLLNVELQSRGIAASMYVLGGAAIALAHDSMRRTQDVDALPVPTDQVLAAARAVADAEGIPLSWLNTNAAWWIPPRSGISLAAPIEVGLRIEIATPEALLAMKLVASRNRDLPDIRMLAEETGLIDPKDLADLVLAQYGDQLDAVHGGYDER